MVECEVTRVRFYSLQVMLVLYFIYGIMAVMLT